MKKLYLILFAFAVLFGTVCQAEVVPFLTEDEVREISMKQYRWLMDGLQIEQKKVIKSITLDIY